MEPEMRVRRLAHSLGYRYRLHARDLPGKPDLVFRSRHKVIFVHGCFWHQHDAPECPCRHTPASNLSYWKPKLNRNVERDKQQQALLTADGWKVLIVWECETNDSKWLRTKIRRFLGPTGAIIPTQTTSPRDNLSG